MQVKSACAGLCGLQGIEITCIFHYNKGEGMSGQKLQWHPGFQAVMQIELQEEKDYLQFELERSPDQITVTFGANKYPIEFRECTKLYR